MRLIDADALITNNRYEDWVDWNDKVVFEYIIEEAPTIESEPVKHGRWVWDSNNDKYFCSECNKEPLGDCYGGCVSHLSDYCPYCGAKMDLEDGNCSLYHTEHGKPVCYGTKEREECTCEGNRKNCDFYPNP